MDGVAFVLVLVLVLGGGWVGETRGLDGGGWMCIFMMCTYTKKEEEEKRLFLPHPATPPPTAFTPRRRSRKALFYTLPYLRRRT